MSSVKSFIQKCTTTAVVGVAAAYSLFAGSGPADAWVTAAGHAGSGVWKNEHIFITLSNPLPRRIRCDIVIAPRSALPTLTVVADHLNEYWRAAVNGDHAGADTAMKKVIADQSTLSKVGSSSATSVTIRSTKLVVEVKAFGATSLFPNPPYAGLTACSDAFPSGTATDGDAHAFPISQSYLTIPTNIPKVITSPKPKLTVPTIKVTPPKYR
ncbi:hypothetical protein [Gordonia sp. (in: high G+C Gram-positive bacteria)]|uniref:hypothetical protein n=1 Tax=Gordonia sp. (in: high G+C Gram-positive bacteria) TaxID=84139 RepID=UPI00260D59E6|nr:hypothetical protein [Gordonia sp. (in: high G+C Gram-positive bacteria)]HMS76075.1 hypothetical protein [Gordonia sp. (in: high G+C Gram-positive bacteria)]